MDELCVILATKVPLTTLKLVSLEKKARSVRKSSTFTWLGLVLALQALTVTGD